MRRIISTTLFMMALVLTPSFAKAQNNDTFKKHTLKSAENTNTSKEQKVDRKAKQAPVRQAVKEEVKPQSKVNPTAKKPSNELVIINPCKDWLDFEFIELAGSTSEQTLSLTFNFTNRNVNERMYVGYNILAYDDNGGEHKCYGGKYFDTKTDVMISHTIEIPGKVLPSKVKKLAHVSFKIGDCEIEMRNVPIEWR